MSRILLKLALPIAVVCTLLLGAGVAFGATLDDTPVVITGRVTGSRTNADVFIVASTARNLQIVRRVPVTPVVIDLAPQGRRVIVLSHAQGTQRQQITFVDTVTGHARRLPGGYAISNTYWAPTGERVAVLSVSPDEAGIYVADARAGAVTQVAGVPWNGIIWSPDGETMALIVGGALRSIRNDGTASNDIMSETGDFDRFDWSPDGQMIALRSASPNAIHIVNADGTDLRNLTAGYEFESLSFPRWSPDGTHLAFSAVHQNRLVAYVVPVATGELIPIMDLPMFRDTRIIQVNWSRDSRSVGLLTASSRNDPHWYVVDRDSGAVQFDMEGVLPGPWSPDGSAFLYYVPDYTSPAYTTYQTYLVAGDAEPRLIEDDGSDMRWLPDGESLIYTRSQVVTAGSVRTELERRLYLLDLDGGGRYLTPPGIFVTDYTVLQD